MTGEIIRIVPNGDLSSLDKIIEEQKAYYAPKKEYTSRRFHVTHQAGGSLDVLLTPTVVRWMDEEKSELRDVLGHEAWRELFKTSAAPMLTKLCDKLGVDRVKKEFIANIEYEEEL